jgi:molecular chaperone HtpG
LISNSADACEKLRYLAAQDPALTKDDPDFAITLDVDDKTGTLIVADNGIGMSHAELIENLGTIAHSGTRAFLDGLEQKTDGTALIGQFGIGFYSAFMVADRVEVISNAVGSDACWVWRSDGKGAYTVEPAKPEEAVSRGTRVILHLNEAAKDYASEATVERIVGAYSAHIPVAIRLHKAGEETTRELADGAALWVRQKSEISDQEYKEFYGHVGGQFDDPAVTIHYRAEGRHEYSVLMFVPTMKPFDLFDPDRKGRIKLYVRRVFISDDAAVLPAWLRFMRGVIDSEDLPLNLSREMLQSNPILESIRNGVTNRILSELGKVAEEKSENYQAIWNEFGPVLKEGLYEDMERRDKLFGLVRFKSTAGGEDWRSLSQYVGDLKPNQTEIYYVLGESPEAVRASPQLEGFKARGVEVLLLSDPVDAFWVQTAIGFDGKPFKSITQGAANIDDIPLEDETGDGESARDADIATLIVLAKQTLGDAVSDVRPSTRLSTSAVCIVAADLGPDIQLEKIVARHQGGQSGPAPVLELNARHALIIRLAEQAAAGQNSDAVEQAAWLLLGQARILDGATPDDPADFADKMSALMVTALG